MKDLILLYLAFQFGYSFSYVFKDKIKNFIKFNKDCFLIPDLELKRLK